MKIEGEEILKVTIYIDVIFLENFILNYIILFGTGFIAKIKMNFFRIGIRWIYRKYLCNNRIFN